MHDAERAAVALEEMEGLRGNVSKASKKVGTRGRVWKKAMQLVEICGIRSCEGGDGWGVQGLQEDYVCSCVCVCVLVHAVWCMSPTSSTVLLYYVHTAVYQKLD
jgi:hypothetical protein